ncbi:hypothetical protein Tasa_009_242 [Tanticharoenia sakaeratensis NBRC 103193]|uniref:Major royal jelly protein n=2 Tax=Tanticharoenia TaxID=444052 RepID=A0A0D6MIJ3_9PROT|nr:hypothetical protein Tasa_009_242 [Tanticharoenia sakaeratensis NBRC 103193]GBQ20629.1 hypothetical protein AA103193_1446 [Tanticharoenia sakaeratensis NBRC 103193]
MKRKRRWIAFAPFAGAVALMLLSSARAAPALQTIITSDRVMNAVTVSDDGRIFISFPYWGGGKATGPSVTELDHRNRPHPYPDANWNAWPRTHDAAHSFVRVNAIRIGPDGKLWVVDSGEANVGGKENPPDGARPKLVAIDLSHNTVDHVIPLDRAVTPHSYIDDLRFAGPFLFLTDAGDPALVVIDTRDGSERRVLQHARSTTDERDMMAEGHVLTTGGKPARIQADQIETAPDGHTVYFQPSSGPLFAAPAAALEDPNLSEAQLEAQVRQVYDTPTTGGTAIDGNGNLYVSDVDHLKILKISPDGRASTLIADPRLVWADAMWIDSHGRLWIPAVQLDRTATFQPDGQSRVKLPVAIYRMDMHLKPAR